MSSPESRPLIAALWMTGAVASFSLMAIGGREVAGQLDTFELMFCRSLIGVVVVVAYGLLARRMTEARTERLGLHGLRNLFHFTAQNLWFYAAGLIPLAQLFAIEFTTPIWIALLAPFLLAERMTLWRLMAALLGFTGIMVILQPGTATFSIGHLTAALSTLGFCGSIIATKVLARTESTFTILFWLTVMQAGYGFVTVFHDGAMTLPNAANLHWVVIVGICGLTAHICLTQALQIAPASVVAPMDFARLPLIGLVGWLLYAEPLTAALVIGAALILGGNALNLTSERRRAAPVPAQAAE